MSDHDTGGRTGRRPGRSGTREAILAAARVRFAEVGFDKASIRSIAGAAGVDAALVHHYFGTKQELFAEAVRLPADPRIVVDALAAAPIDDLGAQIVRSVVSLWDSPAGDGALAIFRSVVAGEDPVLIRSLLLEVVLRDVVTRVDTPAGSGRTRVALAVTQIAGVLVARRIVGLEPIASMTVDELAAQVGPTLQRYLTGEFTAELDADSPRARRRR